MESLKFITSLTFALSGLMAVGIIARITCLILTGIMTGEAVPELINKMTKKLTAAIIAICLSTFLGIIKHYYF
ncbi:hypothetical protein RZO55_10415 [Clostridium boliviensis]|uniref:Uncharacterized protein n=1 Tax=Clostridium boliviensis TaxID=318465 RepID=A0ABU4GK42_9CLOT|nr:hypothetical protein [Clostridium boliviensis]MDW2797988.1 hypothetical protein [Clostridium boliviensis]